MLSALHIENIAVIKKADIDFRGGFTVLTGETGAGKSILVDSINFLLGARTSKDIIRSGEKKAVVSGLFCDIKDVLSRCPEELDVVPDEDGCIYLSRTIFDDGRTQAKLNGRTIPLSVQKALSAYLINIHGQHDTQALLSPSTHIEFLDNFAGLGEKTDEFGKFYDAMNSCKSRIASLTRDGQEKARLTELLKYQIADIDGAKLKPGEEEELETRRKQVKNIEKIMKQARLVSRALYSNDKILPACELVKRSISALEAIEDCIPKAKEYIQKLNEIQYELEDIGITVGDAASTGYDNPEEELDRIESRLETITKLKRKYGSDIPSILAYREKSAAELDDIDLSDLKITELNRELDGIMENVKRLASEITEIRKNAARKLETRITEELTFLEMPKVRFRVDIKRSVDESGKTQYNRRGGDSVEFLISANPGEPLKPISKIASGGELSRIMLALKSTDTSKGSGTALIFDEIDTGISGKTSQKIGLRLRALAGANQVICVTHSAQIAAAANNHYLISKQECDGRVETFVGEIAGEERVREIARIMGGMQITEKLLDTAREMLGGYGDELNKN